MNYKIIFKINKGGVDTLDHLIENFSCRRKTKKWTTNTFFYMLDVAAYNAYSLFIFKKPESISQHGIKRRRRVMLEKLSVSLIKPQIQARLEKFESVNFKHVQYEITKSISHLGFEIKQKELTKVALRR